MSNFRSGFLERGYPLGMLEITADLFQNDMFLDVTGISLVRLFSDSTTPLARSFSFTQGTIIGQTLTILYSGTGSTTCLLSTAAQPYIRLTSAWTPQENDMIQFIWVNNIWLEMMRINSGGGPSGDWSVVDLPSYDVTKWESNATAQKFEAGRLVITNGFFTSLVNGNTEVLGLWPAGYAPSEIIPDTAFSFATVLRHQDGTTEFTDLGATNLSYGITPVAATGDRVYMNFVYLPAQ